MLDLMVKLYGITFKNPIFIASGTFGFGLDFKDVSNRVGAIFTKGITMKPRAGNPPPRIVETAAGLINWVGLENPGIDYFCREILPAVKELKCRVFVNVAGFSVSDYEMITEKLADRADGLEINVSCPNVKEGGVLFGQNPRIAAQVTTAVRRRTRRPVIVKLTPNFCDPLVIGKACIDAGADGLSLINTVFGQAYDACTSKRIISGGLSGPAIKPFALHCVNRVAVLGAPVIGIGGIETIADVREFFAAGASAVAIGSALLRDPYLPLEIVKEFEKTSILPLEGER